MSCWIPFAELKELQAHSWFFFSFCHWGPYKGMYLLLSSQFCPQKSLKALSWLIRNSFHAILRQKGLCLSFCRSRVNFPCSDNLHTLLLKEFTPCFCRFHVSIAFQLIYAMGTLFMFLRDFHTTLFTFIITCLHVCVANQILKT